MAPLILAAIKGVLARRAVKSVTSWIGGALVVGGSAAAVDPKLLELIPEDLRGAAVAVIGVAVVLARHRAEIATLYRELRDQFRAPTPPEDTQ